jgi:predicted esterase
MSENSITEHHFKTEKKARYFTIGNLNQHTKIIWVVLHGYGFLADHFIQWFKILSDDNTLIIAPEALSRAYISGTRGKVGASWMTKEDRLVEIQDYVNYLNNLIGRLTDESVAKPEINCIGFSQGVATACRWVASDKIPIRKLILWAGSPPFDTDYMQSTNMVNAEILMCFGSKDKYIPEGKVKEIEKFFQQLNQLKITITHFEGGHEINKDVLKKIFRKYHI